jgi:hypothetical protein
MVLSPAVTREAELDDSASAAHVTFMCLAREARAPAGGEGERERRRTATEEEPRHTDSTDMADDVYEQEAIIPAPIVWAVCTDRVTGRVKRPL